MPDRSPILLVSDIPGETETLERMLIQVAGRRGVHVVHDEEAALLTIEQERNEIVFSQLSAGPLASIYLLNEVWQRNPKSSRFLVAASMDDPDALVRCVLGAHQFIAHPVDQQRLAAALERANAVKKFVGNEKIQGLVSKMRTLPTRPSLYLDVMRELRSQRASAATVGELVAKDLAISTKLIQVVNSAFYGVEQQVTDLPSAVLLLGLEMTASLVLSIEAFARFDKLKPLYFSIDRVWKHSQTVAELARKICQTLHCEEEICAQAYTAGLVHDIGKLALAQNFEEKYQKAIKQAEARNVPIREVEQEIFGASHTETGAYLLAIWGLALPIVEAVADHHISPGKLEPPFSAATALHLAERLTAHPENLGEILAEYPVGLGLLQRVEDFERLLGIKVRSRPPAVETATTLSSQAVPSRPRDEKQILPTSVPLIRQRPIQWAAFAAAVALIGLSVYFFVPARQTALRAEASKTEAARAPQSPSPIAVAEPLPQEPPPVPQSPPSIPNPKLNLQAILFNGAKSSAIIGGKLFRLGDEVEGIRIVAIHRQEVIVETSAGARAIVPLP